MLSLSNITERAQEYYNNLENKNSLQEEWYQLPDTNWQIKVVLLPDNEAEMRFRNINAHGTQGVLYTFQIPDGGARRKKGKSKRNKRRTKRNKRRTKRNKK